MSNESEIKRNKVILRAVCMLIISVSVLLAGIMSVLQIYFAVLLAMLSVEAIGYAIRGTIE